MKIIRLSLLVVTVLLGTVAHAQLSPPVDSARTSNVPAYAVSPLPIQNQIGLSALTINDRCEVTTTVGDTDLRAHILMRRGRVVDTIASSSDVGIMSGIQKLTNRSSAIGYAVGPTGFGSFFYQRGVRTQLPPGGTYQGSFTAHDVNEFDAIVGGYWVAGEELPIPARLFRGRISSLAATGMTVVAGENDVGGLVGYSFDVHDFSLPNRPLAWIPGRGSVKLRVPAPYQNAVARKINNANQIVGESVDVNAQNLLERATALRWSPSGAVQDIGTAVGVRYSYTIDQNERGQILIWGTSDPEFADFGHYLWLGTRGFVTLKNLPGTDGKRYQVIFLADLNNRGEAIGMASVTDSLPASVVPVVVHPEGYIPCAVQ